MKNVPFICCPFYHLGNQEPKRTLDLAGAENVLIEQKLKG